MFDDNTILQSLGMLFYLQYLILHGSCYNNMFYLFLL